MKKFDGRVRGPLVSPDQGKNGLDGPGPSSSIFAGTSEGLRMMCVFLTRVEVMVGATGADTAAMTATAHAAATGARSPGAPRRRIESVPPIASGTPPAN